MGAAIRYVPSSLSGSQGKWRRDLAFTRYIWERFDVSTFLTYSTYMQTVIETETFLRDAKAVGLTEQERSEIVDFIAWNPAVGDEIKGTGGARKVRFAGKGKGKSGGYRVITFYSGSDIPVFLLNVFAKNEKIDLSQAERNELKTILVTLAGAYRRRKEP